ncbi:MAG: bacteriophage N4 adsorption protein NrfB [Oceanicaulis sp. HLUCCA04]|nr:MAG: bacteriophage N4 adsorption protein NrfB [Oceanicaulis sp. HLUCCA04]
MDWFSLIEVAAGLIGGLGEWFADPATRQDLGEAVRVYWTVLSWATVYAALVIFVSSIDDTFLDLYYWVLTAQNLAVRPFRRTPSVEKLRAMPEKRFAVLIPAWQEADVIARMVDHTIQELDYAAYDIFIGVYPNDADTIREADALVARHANVYRANVGHPGPTSKADCLNWIIQNAIARESHAGKRYEAFVMHDSEDVIHPLSFKVMNAWLDRADMVQLPVLSMPRAWNALVAGHYMDEFAEWHTKDLVVRSHMTAQVPSAGVATALSRRIIDLLNAERENLPFNTDSLTEDYDIGHRLYEAGFKSAFVRYFARVKVTSPAGRRRTRVELVCTREFFPDKMSVSVKQKSRWMLGISFMGWRQLGWTGPFVHRYFLYRDRKAIWTAPTGMLAYFIVFQWALYWLVSATIPEAGDLPPLIDPQSWVWAIVLINFWFLLNRVLHRLIFTGTTHGLKYIVLAPVRMVVGNYIGFLAAARAMRRWIVHCATGNAITWDKTMHAYPSLEEIRRTQSSFASHAQPPGRRALPAGLTASLGASVPMAGPLPAKAPSRVNANFEIDRSAGMLEERRPAPPPMPVPARIAETTA